MNKRQRMKTYEERSVLAWMHSGETYAEAKKRLEKAWEDGSHPLQIQRRKN